MPPMVGVQKLGKAQNEARGSRLWCCAPARYCYFWRCSGRGENRNLSRQYERERRQQAPGRYRHGRGCVLARPLYADGSLGPALSTDQMLDTLPLLQEVAEAAPLTAPASS